MDLNVRRKTLADFQRELKACTSASAARDVVESARLALSRQDYSALVNDYRIAFEG